jgi:hypothetical protein
MNAVHRLHPARSLNARIAMKSGFHGQITVGYWMGCARLRKSLSAMLSKSRTAGCGVAFDMPLSSSGHAS